MLLVVSSMVLAFGDEEIRFLSVWLKQPILTVDTSNFSEDNKVIDFSISFKTPTGLGGVSEGMYCTQKYASSEEEKNLTLEEDRWIYIQLYLLNDGKTETVSAENYSVTSKNSINFTYEKPRPEHISLKIIPEEINAVKCVEGRLNEIYGTEYFTIQGSLEYDDFSTNQEYKVDTQAGESTGDEVDFTLPLIIEEEIEIIEVRIIEESIIETPKEIETIESIIGEAEIIEELEIIESEIIEEKIEPEIEEKIIEPVFIPEPITEEKKCGTGTELVNGYCEVIKNDVQESKEEEKGFFDWLMSLFGFD